VSDGGRQNQHTQRYCGWAVASFAASVLFLCPVLTVLAPILGWRALIACRQDPTLRGRNLARAGIGLGICTTILSVAFLIWFIPRWDARIRQPLLTGPQTALRAGADGGPEAFLAHVMVPTTPQRREEAATFLANLEARYGRFLQSMQSTGRQPDSETQNRQAPRLAYVLQFERREVVADVQIEFVPDGLFADARLRWIRVIDADLGDLVYPPDATIDPVVDDGTGPIEDSAE
jgi:hypothetical protein